MALDGEVSWSFGDDSARNVIFSVDTTSLSHTDDRINNFLLLAEVLADGINDTTGAAKNKFSIYFSRAKIKLC